MAVMPSLRGDQAIYGQLCEEVARPITHTNGSSIKTGLMLICEMIHSVSLRGGSGTMGWLRLVSRLLKIIGLFCRIHSLLQGSFAKQTYVFRKPTNRSHPVRTRMYARECAETGSATIRRLLQIIGLFCKIVSSKGSFAKETYNFKEPTNRSNPIRTRKGENARSGSCHTYQWVVHGRGLLVDMCDISPVTCCHCGGGGGHYIRDCSEWARRAVWMSTQCATVWKST